MKLTPAQLALLSEIAPRQMSVADHYAPAKKLVELGYATWIYKKYGAYLAITDAGRAALNQKGNPHADQ